jgi:hypothetical protein
MLDPKGKIIQTNVPPGAFGNLLDWPTSDWLGTTLFSEGGGFYPVKNKDTTSTLLYAPINQTGTYTLLLHSTLFGGKSTTEPLTVVAKFSSLSIDNIPPTITLPVSKFIGDIIPQVQITDDGQVSVKYYLDQSEINYDDLSNVAEGQHNLTIEATDETGNSSVQLYSFVVDKTKPEILVVEYDDKISNLLQIDFIVNDVNLDEISISLPDGTILKNQNQINLDTSNLNDGKHQIIISAIDKAGNKNEKTISFEVSKAITPKPSLNTAFDYDFILLLIAGVFAIGITIFIILGTKSQKSPKY